jgi:hypothetical protein
MKKLRHKSKAYIVIFIVALGFLNACSDELKYDVNGDKINRVFVNTETTPINGYNFPVTHTPVSDIGTILAAFPARCTQGASTDLNVLFKVDNSLISTYNSAHSTTYGQVPDSLISVVNSSVTIPKGAITSNDSIKLSITNRRLSYLTSPGYVIPVRLFEVNIVDNTTISTNLNIVYIVITTSWTNCYNSPLITDMVGALITPRTTWTSTLDAALVSGTLPQMFDGSTTTYWRINPGVFNLVVDLKTPCTTISGIRTNSNSTSYGLTQVIVSSSNDGVTWIYQGTPTLSTASAYQYIKFYGQISARYLKIQSVTMRSTSRMYLAEFDVYKN